MFGVILHWGGGEPILIAFGQEVEEMLDKLPAHHAANI